jgi:hypothetical protein
MEGRKVSLNLQPFMQAHKIVPGRGKVFTLLAAHHLWIRR